MGTNTYAEMEKRLYLIQLGGRLGKSVPGKKLKRA